MAEAPSRQARETKSKPEGARRGLELTTVAGRVGFERETTIRSNNGQEGHRIGAMTRFFLLESCWTGVEVDATNAERSSSGLHGCTVQSTIEVHEAGVPDQSGTWGLRVIID
jgi:hypothetical protein